MERFHCEEKLYDCAFCNRKFKTNGDLKVWSLYFQPTIVYFSYSFQFPYIVFQIHFDSAHVSFEEKKVQLLEARKWAMCSS